MKFSLKHSFAWRVCFIIIPIVIVIFSGIMILFYNLSREKIITAYMDHANEILANMSLKIDKQLQSVSQTIDNSAWLVAENIDNSQTVEKILKQNIQNNPLIIGGSV